MKRRRVILFTLLSLLIVLKLHGFLSVFALTSNNQSENNINTFLSNTYIVGDLVDFPNLVINDDVYDRVVYSPSGQGYISDSLNLDESGQWKIVYSHQNDYKVFDVVFPFQSTLAWGLPGLGWIIESTILSVLVFTASSFAWAYLPIPIRAFGPIMSITSLR